MSVRTTADEKIDRVKELLKEAHKELLTVLDEDIFGHSDFRQEYIENLYQVAVQLLDIRRKL